MNEPRRKFIGMLGLAAACPNLTLASSPADADKKLVKQTLFDGRSLDGWKAIPRLIIPKEPRFQKMPTDQLRPAVNAWHEERPELHAKLKHIGEWKVEDNAIVGGHAPPESLQGAYLLSEKTFGDFELELEAKPDWPIDTGIMIRAHELGSIGFQVLVDHRPKGGIGGVYGNNIGNFLAAPFTVDGDKLPAFRVENLREGSRESNFQAPRMNYAASFMDFVKVWRTNDWNRIKIRCVGDLPVITTWINDLQICELDTATIDTTSYDPELVKARLGRSGHIGFEVHDINLTNPLGADRWAQGGVCRWRNISIVEL